MNSALSLSSRPAASMEIFSISGYIPGQIREANLMQPEPAPLWTPEQGRRYELLREIITIYVGNVMAEIYAEEAKPAPRKGMIAAFNSHLADVHAERKGLRVEDDAQIAAAMAKYEALNQAFDEASTIVA